MPKSIRRIDNGAFKGCVGLKSIEMGDSLHEIGWEAFMGCVNLSIIELPDSVWGIGREAFAGCENMKEISLNDSLEFIDNGVFDGCNSLEEIIIPERTYVDVWAFGHCERLRSVKVGGGSRIPGRYEDMYVGDNPERVKYGMMMPPPAPPVYGGMFTECKLLEYVMLCDGIEEIPAMAFAGCSRIREIDIPRTVKMIGRKAFKECHGLKEVRFIRNGECVIDNYAFAGCDSLERIEFGRSVSSIGTAAFCGCIRLREVVWPDSVKAIGNNVFTGCKRLEKVTIPEGVSMIGEKMFTGCDSLRSVYCMSAEPPIIYKDTWKGVYDGERRKAERVTLYVPQGSERRYRKAEGWGKAAAGEARNMRFGRIKAARE